LEDTAALRTGGRQADLAGVLLADGGRLAARVNRGELGPAGRGHLDHCVQGEPAEVVDYLAEQLGIAYASVLKAYGERENTRLDHVRDLRRVLEYTAFAEAEAELRVWVDARAWTTGEGPKALFDAATGWLRERRVLLPGVTTLARLVASVREARTSGCGTRSTAC
jgi:hypothetical protein